MGSVETTPPSGKFRPPTPARSFSSILSRRPRPYPPLDKISSPAFGKAGGGTSETSAPEFPRKSPAGKSRAKVRKSSRPVPFRQRSAGPGENPIFPLPVGNLPALRHPSDTAAIPPRLLFSCKTTIPESELFSQVFSTWGKMAESLRYPLSFGFIHRTYPQAVGKKSQFFLFSTDC